MSIAPYFVLWVFPLIALGVLLGGLGALVWPEFVRAVARRLDWSDPVAAWLVGAGLHRLATGAPLDARVWGNDLAWGSAAAGLALWALLRCLPARWRRPALTLGCALALWAFVIGAGEVYVGEMQADTARLEAAPAAALDPEQTATGSRAPRVLARTRHFDRLDPVTRALRDEVIRELDAGGTPDAGLRAVAVQQLVPPLLEHYRRDLSRLRSYQWIQIGLLAALLMAWGFGERVGGAEWSGRRP